MTSPKAKTLARRLIRENRKRGRSWRQIAREDFANKISHATLCQFALAGGEWLPKDGTLLIALGLKKERAPRVVVNQSLHDMATATLRKMIENRQEMPPVDPRILREFKKLGWLKKVTA